MMICNKIREVNSIGEVVVAFQKLANINHSQYSTASLTEKAPMHVDEEVLLKMICLFNTAKQRSPTISAPN